MMHKSLAGRRAIEQKARAIRQSKQQAGRGLDIHAVPAQVIASKFFQRSIRLKRQNHQLATARQMAPRGEPVVVVDFSTLTDRYQTTIPEKVREALHLGKRDKIAYALRDDGVVELRRDAPGEADDPALGPFLSLLASDMQTHPEHLQPATRSFYERMMSAVRGVEVNLNERLPDD